MREQSDMQPPDPSPLPSANLADTYREALEQQAWAVDAAERPPAPAEPSAEAPPPLARIVEAMLFIGGPPLTAARACEAVRGLTEEQFGQAIDGLNHDYRRQGRPYLIQPHGAGYLLTLRPRYRSVPDKLFGPAREARLSQAAIDVLSLIAYRQPATKQEIDSLRGAESRGVIQQLVRRGLVAVVSRGDADQREVKYGTTPRFLELFGLQSLDDLPQTQDLQRI